MPTPVPAVWCANTTPQQQQAMNKAIKEQRYTAALEHARTGERRPGRFQWARL